MDIGRGERMQRAEMMAFNIQPRYRIVDPGREFEIVEMPRLGGYGMNLFSYIAGGFMLSAG